MTTRSLRPAADDWPVTSLETRLGLHPLASRVPHLGHQHAIRVAGQTSHNVSRILKFVSDLHRFVTILETGREPGQSVSKTKVTANVTPRGRSEVFSASTRSKKYSLFVIWHHRECDSPPSTSFSLTLPYTSFRIPLESLSAKRKPKEGVKEKRNRRR